VQFVLAGPTKEDYGITRKMDSHTRSGQGRVSSQPDASHMRRRLNLVECSKADDGTERVLVKLNMDIRTWSCVVAIAEECHASVEDVLDAIFDFSERNKTKLRSRIKSRHKLVRKNQVWTGVRISKKKINVLLILMPFIGMVLAILYIIANLMK